MTNEQDFLPFFDGLPLSDEQGSRVSAFLRKASDQRVLDAYLVLTDHRRYDDALVFLRKCLSFGDDFALSRSELIKLYLERGLVSLAWEELMKLSRAFVKENQFIRGCFFEASLLAESERLADYFSNQQPQAKEVWSEAHQLLLRQYESQGFKPTRDSLVKSLEIRGRALVLPRKDELNKAVLSFLREPSRDEEESARDPAEPLGDPLLAFWLALVIALWKLPWKMFFLGRVSLSMQRVKILIL